MKIRGVWFFAAIEVLIGLVSLSAVTFSLIQGNCIKPPEVIAFVLGTALISCGLGIGILTYNIHCYHLLLYFSSVIILSKILIFAKIITLSGALETTLPFNFKNAASVIYHTALIFYFTRSRIKKQFLPRP